MTHKNAKYHDDEDYYYMVNDEITTTKYLIHAQINAKGFVEKPDVVGAIFGQTEGLLTDSLDLRELQKTGRIGRIQVDMDNKSGRTKGEVIVPSSLDRVETTILAASLETINRVGPCEAYLRVIEIEDVRAVKRRIIVERATELYQEMMKDFTPENSKMIEQVKESIRIPEIIEYGDDCLPAGPNTPDSDAILIVEGRSDVLNLLKYGIKNTIAVEGVNIPDTVVDLTKTRTVTAFLDGDRGGDLILKELLQVGDIDYVTRAPRGLEVEFLDKDQVIYALKNKTSVDKITDQANFNHNQHRYNNNNNTNKKTYNNKKDSSMHDYNDNESNNYDQQNNKYNNKHYNNNKYNKKNDNKVDIKQSKNNNDKNTFNNRKADINNPNNKNYRKYNKNDNNYDGKQNKQINNNNKQNNYQNKKDNTNNQNNNKQDNEDKNNDNNDSLDSYKNIDTENNSDNNLKQDNKDSNKNTDDKDIKNDTTKQQNNNDTTNEEDNIDVNIDTEKIETSKTEIVNDKDSKDIEKEDKNDTPVKTKYENVLDELSKTNSGRLYDDDCQLIDEVSVDELFNKIKTTTTSIKTVIFDGIISQRLIDLAKEKNIELIVAVRMSEVVKKPETIKIITK